MKALAKGQQIIHQYYISDVRNQQGVKRGFHERPVLLGEKDARNIPSKGFHKDTAWPLQPSLEAAGRKKKKKEAGSFLYWVWEHRNEDIGCILSL